MSIQSEINRIKSERDAQTTDLASIESQLAEALTLLENKAAGGGEDVTSETTAYTEELAEITSVIAALEAELEEKTSGAGGVPTVEIVVQGKIVTEYEIIFTNSTLSVQTIVVSALSANDTRLSNVAINTLLFIKGDVVADYMGTSINQVSDNVFQVVAGTGGTIRVSDQ